MRPSQAMGSQGTGTVACRGVEASRGISASPGAGAAMGHGMSAMGSSQSMASAEDMERAHRRSTPSAGAKRHRGGRPTVDWRTRWLSPSLSDAGRGPPERCMLGEQRSSAVHRQGHPPHREYSFGRLSTRAPTTDRAGARSGASSRPREAGSHLGTRDRRHGPQPVRKNGPRRSLSTHPSVHVHGCSC